MKTWNRVWKLKLNTFLNTHSIRNKICSCISLDFYKILFNKSTAVLFGSDMINTVLFWGVSQYLWSTDYAERFSSLTINFHTKESYFFQIDPFSYGRIPGLSWYEAIFVQPHFIFKGKGAARRRLREDNRHLSRQNFHHITETMWNVIWYYIYIVKVASEHYIWFILCKKKNTPSTSHLRYSSSPRQLA